MNVYFDTEFSSLVPNTSLISIGLITENGRKFYAEFLDYNKKQITDWIDVNVLSKTYMKEHNVKSNQIIADNKKLFVIGDKKYIKKQLIEWLSKYKKVDFYSDVLAYDWMLLQDLLADYVDGYPKLPENIYYIPFDLATYFKIYGIDPDINREEFAEIKNAENKHNALHDAEVIKKCFNKLAEIKK